MQFIVLMCAIASPLAQDLDASARLKLSLTEKFNRLKMPALMTERIKSRAAEVKLSDQKRGNLKKAIPATIAAVVSENVAKLLSRQDAGIDKASLFAVDSFERTEAWRKLLADELDEKQFKKWQILQKARITEEIERKFKAEQAERNAPRAAAVRGAPAFGGPPRPTTTAVKIESIITRERVAYRKIVEDELAELRVFCQLSDKQARKLEIAAKGAAKKAFSAIDAEMKKLEDSDETQPDITESMPLLRQLTTFRTRGREQGFEFWTKTVNATLTESQRKRLQKERAAQLQFNSRAWAYKVLTAFDRVTKLTMEQRQQSLEQLLTLTPIDRSSPTFAPATASAYLAGVPQETREALTKILTPDQITAIKKPPRSTRSWGSSR